MGQLDGMLVSNLEELQNLGGVAQMARASACHAESRRFKSGHSRQNTMGYIA